MPGQHPKGTQQGLGKEDSVGCGSVGQRLGLSPRGKEGLCLAQGKHPPGSHTLPDGRYLSPWQAWDKGMGTWTEALILLDVGGYPPKKGSYVGRVISEGGILSVLSWEPITLFVRGLLLMAQQ